MPKSETVRIPEDVHVRYLRGRPGNCRAPWAVLLVRVRDEGRGLLEFGWSRCSKRDQFNRSTGRKIALARLAAYANGRTPRVHPDLREPLTALLEQITGRESRRMEESRA